MPRKAEYENPRVFTTRFEHKIIDPFEEMARMEGRTVNKVLAEFMAEYVKTHQPNLSNMTMERWFAAERFIATPALFDKASIWDKYLGNNCTEKETLEIIDQCDAIAYAARLKLAARRLKETKKGASLLVGPSVEHILDNAMQAILEK